jgi:hypothetical protein
MSYVVYAYKEIDGKTVCHAYTDTPAPTEGFGEPTPLGEEQAQSAAGRLRSEGWTAMALSGEALPWNVPVS